MKTALVTSIGSVAGDIVIKSLKQHNYRVVGCDIYPKEWVVDANNVDAFYRAPLSVNTQSFLSFIKEICLNERINYILPLTDIDVDFFNNNRDWFIENGICLCISPQNSLDIIRNKKKLADYIDINCPDINTIPTRMLSSVLEDIPWKFPLVCKPYDGRSSQGLRFIYTNEEWEQFKQTADQKKYIVQPYIEGECVMVEIVRQSEPHNVVAITRLGSLLRTSNNCGLTVYIYQDKLLEEACKKMADVLGVIGCVNFEFLRCKDGTYYLVECNPRFSAGCEFSCMAGYDCVGNHMRAFNHLSIDDFEFKHNMYMARKYEEYITKIEED
ncbi:MAG: ATP-grasp domain-containing protein [Lachnospiraceae bacterium]|nr:ATP-grasp domain-containing protein [Agathobacter sp.]MDD5999824.1 ATP-grasp domain-containing protein [Lachnospiraceae bacterium]